MVKRMAFQITVGRKSMMEVWRGGDILATAEQLAALRLLADRPVAPITKSLCSKFIRLRTFGLIESAGPALWKLTEAGHRFLAMKLKRIVLPFTAYRDAGYRGGIRHRSIRYQRNLQSRPNLIRNANRVLMRRRAVHALEVARTGYYYGKAVDPLFLEWLRSMSRAKQIVLIMTYVGFDVQNIADALIFLELRPGSSCHDVYQLRSDIGISMKRRDKNAGREIFVPATAMAMLEEGMAVAEIAAYFGVHTDTVVRAVTRHNVASSTASQAASKSVLA